MQIQSLHPDEMEKFFRHKLRLSQENGRDGDTIFSPLEKDYPINEESRKKSVDALLKSVGECGWLRVWTLSDENEIYGDLRLVHEPPVETSLHHCLLMMGIERNARRKGWGTALLSAAISWAKTQETLDWITLNVFENNQPAKLLYRKFGFEAVGTTKDMFRVFGQSLDDTKMVLKLR